MKISMLFYLSLCSIFMQAQAQTFLNGSFEKSKESCHINMTNKEFNSSMANCFAFGSGDQVDILNKDCNWGIPQHGAKFIAMADDNGDNDELSIELTTPLQMDSTYTISFYMRKDGAHNTCKMQMGYSSSYSKFGTVISSIEGVTTEQWEEVKITFTPTSNAKFITLRIVSGGEGWNQLDNFTFVGKKTNVVDPSGADPK